MDTELLTVSQTAQYLQLSEKTIRRMIGNGSLPASKLGNRTWRIRACDVDEYVSNSCQNKPAYSITNLPELELETPEHPRLISLFSGCGGMDLGFKKAGFDIVFANDFDADAQAIYSLNLGEIDKRDILSVGEDEIPDGDILTAGFPCQPFSNAGNRKGVHDSRGMLYKECLRIIQKKMPKVIVFENVKGLLSTKYIDGRNLAEVIVEESKVVFLYAHQRLGVLLAILRLFATDQLDKLYTYCRSLKTNGLFVSSRSQNPRPFSCRCKRGAYRTPLPPSAAPAGITHYTLQARSCAKGGISPLWKPPVLSVRGHRLHFFIYVLTPSKT